MSPRTSFPLLSDSALRLLLAPALVFIACCLDRNYQTDLWHHLARGRVLIEEGTLLDEDRFSYTAPRQSFQDVNWATQGLFFIFHKVGGLPLLQVLNATLLAGTMLGVVILCYRASGSTAAAGAVGIFVFLGTWQLYLIRPQTLSLLLFVWLLETLEEAWKDPRLLVFAPLFLTAWVNMHGAFPIGLVLIGCYLLSAIIESAWEDGWGVLRTPRPVALAVCLAASTLATLVNPYGWRVYEYVLHTSGIAGARKIDEWLPPGLGTLVGVALALSVAALLVLLALPGKRPAVRHVVPLVVFFPLACGSVRMVAWWLIVSAPVLAFLIASREWKASGPWAATPQPPPERKGSVGATLCVVGLIVGMVLSLPWLEEVSPFRFIRPTHRLESDLEKAARHIKTDAFPTDGTNPTTTHVFTRFEWSEYLTWSLGEGFPVFMDGRIEIFPDDVWQEYTLVTSGGVGWDEVLRKYHVDYLLIDAGPYHGRLRPLVEKSPEWEALGEGIGPVQVYRRVKKK